MVVETPRIGEKPPAVALPPLKIPNFRLLWSGWTMIALSIQFYTVALVWLVLQITGSGLELGSVMVAAAIPRAIAMLVSGAIIDRVKPRRVLLLASAISALLVGGIALLLSLDMLVITQLFIIVALQGLMDAFFYPAAMAQMARLVDKTQLTAANSLFQTSDSVANILGPALGGFVIGAIGLTNAFLTNMTLFALGSLIIWLMRRQPAAAATATPAATENESFGRAIISGFRFALQSPVICISLLMVAMLNFAAIGPIIVGGAVLVEQRFGGDAAMYGLITSTYGVGALVGGLGSGFLPPVRRPGKLLALLAMGMGVSLALIGLAPAFWMVLSISLLQGVGVGVVAVIAVSWLQSRTPEQMQGRMASLLIFASVAVDPFSNAISGAMIDVSLTLLFVGAGMLLGLAGAVAWFSRAIHEEA